MENIKTNTKLIMKGILAFSIYFLITQFAYIPLMLLGINLNNLNIIYKCIFIITVQLSIIILIFLLFKKYIIDSFIDFKRNHLLYFNKYFKYWFLILILMMISNGIIAIAIPGETAKNQDAVNDLFNQLPIFTFLLSVFFAPVIEELAFRLSFRAIFKNKFLFILSSGLLFGLFHVIGTYEVPSDLLFILPYSVPGIIFAYLLQKSDNIFVPMSLHFLHNGMLMSLQVFIILFS